MKYLVSIFLLSLSVSSFAASVEETVATIEQEKNVRCDLLNKKIGYCIGSGAASVCWYELNYQCNGNDFFKLTLKVRDFYNQQTQKRETVVRKVSM